jgi:hypothetical protein
MIRASQRGRGAGQGGSDGAGCGRSSHSVIRMRLALPSGSSNCRDRIAQKNATSPAPPNSRETGIRMASICMAYFNLSAFSETVTEDNDMAKAAASGVA